MQVRRGEIIDVLEGDGRVAEIEGRGVGLITWFVGAAADAAGAMVDAGATADFASAGAGSGPGAGSRDDSAAEVRALAVADAARGRGVGRALLEVAEEALRGVGLRRAWLVTTNDNLAALALYQKAGWRLAALRAGALDEARRTLKPALPEIGQHGIPLRDELELARTL